MVPASLSMAVAVAVAIGASLVESFALHPQATLTHRASTSTPLRLCPPRREWDGATASFSSSSTTTIIAVDVENVRGASAFRLSHEALLHRAAAWRSSVGRSEGIAMVFDHGSVRTAHSGGPLAEGLAAIFAGPDITADDVIVSLVGERCGGLGCSDPGVKDGDDDFASGSTTVAAWKEDVVAMGMRNATVVVTADSRLISRCQRARRASPTCSDVAFVEPTSFLRELEAHASEAEEEVFFGIPEPFVEIGTSKLGENCPLGSAIREGASRAEDVDAATVFSSESDGDSHVKDDADMAYVKKEDEDLAMMRTMMAQQRLLRDINSKIGPARRGKAGLAGNTKTKGVISRRQRDKLLSRRHKAKKMADMAEAHKRRQVLAERLRKKLLAAPGAVTAERVPIYRLLEWLSVLCTDGAGVNLGGGDGSAAPLLTYSAGADDYPGEAGPLASVLTVPLRSRAADLTDEAATGGRLPPLRIAVISDTHGFERALLKLPSPMDCQGGGVPPPGAARPDYPVLPRADVLVHCGDFVANGSRARQRESIRKLDSFLAAQGHIPEKIVVRGNHDPETPGRVLFPKSRALYATASKVLTVNGVRFALEPFSRRASRNPCAGAGTVPECDVLVSHEPPRDVLDLTYSGMRVGSSMLRKAVERSKTKPRCWLCGHIHECRGAAKELFVENGEGGDIVGQTTLVVNAANANHGKANRLVAGAVIVDVEREAIECNPDDTSAAAEMHHLDDSAVHCSNGEQAGANGLGLELREMRPGVRRRKGLNNARQHASDGR